MGPGNSQKDLGMSPIALELKIIGNGHVAREVGLDGMAEVV